MQHKSTYSNIALLLLLFMTLTTITRAMVTNHHSLRKHLLSSPKARSYGPFLLSGSPNIAELLAGIGYSHIVVDMEHCPLDISHTTTMLRAVDSAARVSSPTTPIVRLPCHKDIAMTKRVLDVLSPPAGIIFPMVETAEEAQAAVASTRYPEFYPSSSSKKRNDDHTSFQGTRGCAHPFVRASSYGKNTDYYARTSHEDLFTVVQVESEHAINNIPDIAKVDGVDCIFLGPFDISCSIGQMGQFEEGGEVMTLLHRAEKLVLEAAKQKEEKAGDGAHSLVLGGFRSPGRSIQDMFSCGYQFVSGSVDLGLIGQAAMNDWDIASEAITKSK